ncbi:MAG: aminotransferase class I/II-fold pyridoxal phosphate-dependent enzyme [Mariprofundaceae bacterium]|nr:aminotransferase class I/II-fold pyridoxal phosphate-dependent enzyme [Mariprofundaceae bacterium]
MLSNITIQLHQETMPSNFPHGGGVEAAAKAWSCDVSDVLDLSTGLHPAGQPDWLGEWLHEHADLAAHYPDVHGEPARSILANEFGVKPEQVLMTAGAQAVIEVIFQAMQWKSMGVCVPCYHEPIRCAKRAGCRVYAIESGDSFPSVDALWWTSPNNPFGNAEAFPEGLMGVLDESYMLFSERRELGLMSDVIRLGSLTKTFCIPGLRLGYVIADEAIIQKLKAWLPPWPASTLALHLLPKLLPEADMRDLQVKDARERLVKLLNTYHWQSYQSHASFVLARPPAAMPNFAKKKILVRTFPEWEQLQGWVRFGLPYSDDDWQRLEAILCL